MANEVQVDIRKMSVSDTLDTSLRSIAREIALDILPIEDILQNHAIDDNEWERLSTNDRFQRMLQEERELWSSTMNVDERIVLRAKVIVEQTLDDMYQNLVNPHFGDTAKVNLLKEMRTIANLGTREGGVQGAAGEKFVLQINMGTQTVQIEHTMSPPQNIIEGEVIHEEAQAISRPDVSPRGKEHSFEG